MRTEVDQRIHPIAYRADIYYVYKEEKLFISLSHLKCFVDDNIRIRVCRCEVDSTSQTVDDLTLSETWLNMTNCDRVIRI